jgi:serine/threonine protein kinase
MLRRLTRVFRQRDATPQRAKRSVSAAKMNGMGTSGRSGTTIEEATAKQTLDEAFGATPAQTGTLVSTTTAAAAEAPLLANRYRVLSELGRGANAVTYEAEDTQTRRHVALKKLELRALGEWKGLELFEREASILASLNHPGIPHYVSYQQADGPEGPAFLIAQELAPGQSLDRWLVGGWRASPQEAAQIATQVLEVLTYLHDQRPPVIHRDLKPSNLVRDERGYLSLVDFGSVRAVFDQSPIGGSTVAGTFGYMAPEQLRGLATAPSDLYALGATLLHLMTGQSPDRLPQSHLRYDVGRLIQAPPAFVAWLSRLCEPEPENRFQSAAAARAALMTAWPRALTPQPGSSRQQPSAGEPQPPPGGLTAQANRRTAVVHGLALLLLLNAVAVALAFLTTSS